MRILYLCHRFPYPPNSGAKVRAFNTIRHLSQRHDVVVATLEVETGEAARGAGLADYCTGYIHEPLSPLATKVRMGLSLLTTRPATMGAFFSPALKRRVAELLASERFDLAMFHSSSVVQYVGRDATVPLFVDFVDMDSQKWLIYARHRGFPLNLGYWLEGTKLARAEAQIAKRAALSTCATAAETESLVALGSGTPADWFPNGVDLDFFHPSETPGEPGRLSFIGRMDYYPNAECMIDFCTNVLPLIRQRRPTVQLSIVGAEPTAAVRGLAELPGVEVTGTVDDVRPYVWRSAVTVAPLNIARGTQNKILEAMAMGVPVVCSDLAARGVDAVAGEHLLAASTPQGYADAIAGLLDDDAARRRLASAGRARVETHHSWEVAMARLDRLLIEHFGMPI
jgi:sugar transferase (PEP-CTERM/EpsH1 system associated)